MENNHQSSYLDDPRQWPACYYGQPSAVTRKEYLEYAISKHWDDAHSPFRKELLEKRFFSIQPDGSIDRFLRAWVTILISASHSSFFFKRRARRELEACMQDLCILGFEHENDPDACAARDAEWADFAETLFMTCTQKSNYGSTLFGMMPLKEDALIKKIAHDIRSVTFTYPSSFGLAEDFAPFRRVISESFRRRFEKGIKYLPAE